MDLPSIEGVEQHEEGSGDAFHADSDDDGAYDECAALELDAGESPGRSGKPYQGIREHGEDVEQSYEDLCKAYVEKYLNGVDAFLQQSGLAARVSEWQVREARGEVGRRVTGATVA